MISSFWHSRMQVQSLPCVPRVIIALYDAALVYGCAQQAKKTSTKIMQEVLGDHSKFGLVQVQPLGSPRLVNKREPPLNKKAVAPQSSSSA